jgi:hypothetical protein
MSQPVNKVPFEEQNQYEQGKGADAAPDRKVGPAYSGGSLKDNPTTNGAIVGKH